MGEKRVNSQRAGRLLVGMPSLLHTTLTLMPSIATFTFKTLKHS